MIGATGGVGSVLVPMLAAVGSRALAASAADNGYVRGLGADEIVDCRAGDTVDEALCRYPAGVDAVVNLVLPGDALVGVARAIRPGGRLLNIVFPSPDSAALDGAGLVSETIFTSVRAGDLEELTSPHWPGRPGAAASWPATAGARCSRNWSR